MHNYPVKHVTPGMNFGFSPLMCSPFSCDTCEFCWEFPAGAPSWEEGRLEQYALSPVDLVAVHLQGQQRDFAAEREGAALWKSGCHAIPCATFWWGAHPPPNKYMIRQNFNSKVGRTRVQDAGSLNPGNFAEPCSIDAPRSTLGSFHL